MSENILYKEHEMSLNFIKQEADFNVSISIFYHLHTFSYLYTICNALDVITSRDCGHICVHGCNDDARPSSK